MPVGGKRLSSTRLRESRHAVAELLWSLLSRSLAMPLTWMVPRSDKRWVVIGREHGLYLDNAKYFHAWLHINRPIDHKLKFVGEDRETLRRLREAGVSTARYPGFTAIWVLLRTGTIIVDSADHIDHGRVGLSRGARLVQFWHGVPLKEIELVLHRRRLARLGAFKHGIISLQKKILGRYAPCDVLVSTSEYVTNHAFSACFSARRIIASGYPRNDVITSRQDYPSTLINFNVDKDAAASLAAHRPSRRVVLYSPTFRHDRHSPFSAGWMPLDRLSEFAVTNDVLFALKLHPLMAGRYSVDEYEGLIDVDPHTDIYPLLKYVSVMITDYSSIYFDYLLLDRPLLFYPYDYEEYVSSDRRLLFDYEAMTPGPKVYTADDLFAKLNQLLADGDNVWQGARQRVCRLVHDHVDAGASCRLWRALQGD
jgi:CDP-glycerol glycerophosphotransferase